MTPMKDSQILCTWRDSFSGLSPVVDWQPPGLTLQEHVARFRSLPTDFDRHGVIALNGHIVPPELWARIRTRAPVAGRAIELTFHLAPRGGGDGAGKKILGLIASIALSLAGGWIIGGGLAKAFGMTAFSAGSTLAYAAAAGVQLIGSALISSLVPPPTLSTDQRNQRIRNEGAASVSGNIIDPNGPLPRVVGERKVFPPLAAEPLVYFDGVDEVVEACYALAGPHRLTDIRIGAAAASGLAGCEIETREGWPGDAALTLLTRQARTESVQSELTGHTVDGDDGAQLDPTLDRALALPQPLVLATRSAPDEHQLQIIFGQGLHYQGSDTTRMRVPLRLRMRARGSDTWIALPELHFQGASLRQLRATIRLIWSAEVPAPSAAPTVGWVEARVAAPDQTISPEEGGWAAAAAFVGAGDGWMDANNLGTTGVVGVALDRHEARIHLDPGTFAPGRWEIEIIRGASIDAADYDEAAYTVGGSVWALFGARASGTIVRSRDGTADTLYMLRSVSIWNAAPVLAGDVALIALRARNRALDAVSVVAGGWVQDWDGADWRDWVVTSNPAPHVRDMLAGRLNADALDAAAIDTDGLLEWRAHCTAEGYAVNAVFEGKSVASACEVAASCGFARPLRSDLWGVAMDRDRTADAPVQLFTPRNSAGFAWRRAMPRLPDGLRISFRDADNDYDARQITVIRPGGRDSGTFEQVEYDGLVTEAEVRRRAAYDLAQPTSRGTFYSFDAPAEAIVCRMGDLVANQHDTIWSHGGSGRIDTVWLDADSDVVAIDLDCEVPIVARPGFDTLADFGAVEDVSLIGASTSAVIRRQTGDITIHPLLGDGSTSHLEFATPIDRAGIAEDVLVTVGLTTRETLRGLVYSIERRQDFRAAITLIDEAPEVLNG